MIILIFVNANITRRKQLEFAIEALNTNQTLIHFRVEEREEVPCLVNSSSIDPQKVRERFFQQKAWPENGVIITDCKFNNNWFSMTSRDGTIVSTNSWEKIYSPPALKTFLQMELILHVVACAADMTDSMMEGMSHSDSIGCLFDFCQNKADVRFKIIGGHICEVCSGKLSSYGLSADLKPTISHLLETMRLDSIGRATKIKQNTVFTIMKFTNNVANDHSFRYGVLPAFESFGLEVVRADSTPEPGVLIEKILRMIDDAWAIVVLSGEINLNVFFEYGYAFGRNKPIFLIVPSSKISETPTDIKGLEHIVYPDGNFEALKNSIIERLKKLPRFS